MDIQNSQVYVASTHPIWKNGKLLKKFGSLVSLGEFIPQRSILWRHQLELVFFLTADETTFENFNKVALDQGRIFIRAKLQL
jgi:hypothetical protein